MPPPPLRTTEQQQRIRKNEEPGFFPLSYSRIQSFNNCQRRYKYENIDKLGKISGDAAELGSAAHAFQEVMFTEGIERANEIARAMVPLSKSIEWINARNIIESIVIKRDFLYLAEGRMHWEFPVAKNTNEGGSEVYTVQVEAKIDQLFVYPHLNTFEVVDGKSGTQVPTENELKQDLQGKLYSLVVLENLGELGIEKVLFSQAQWKYGRIVTVEYGIEELKEYKHQIIAIAQEMINEQSFKPEPNTHCHWCPFVLQCDAAQKMLPKMVEIAGQELPAIITSDEDAERIGKGVIHLEEIAKRYRAAIKGYVKETGKPVRVGERGGWGFSRRSTLKLGDLSKLMEIAQDKHIDLQSFLNFNNKTGKTLIKNHPEFLEGLNQEQYPWFDFKANFGEDDDGDN